ncbi:MAG: peptidoglycan-binding protein, partial [Pseudomonadota bacterium]
MTGFRKDTRRHFLRSALASAAGLAVANKAAAQSSVMDILQSPQRGAWDDQFDASGTRNKAAINNRLPILSAPTASYVEGAMVQYRDIVSRGGWPRVNATQALRVGVRDNAVSELRRRLIISGDLPRNAGDSSTFDTFLDGALKRFQERHGMVADGVVGNYTLQALNVPADVRLGQLETNLVRLRAMSGFLGDRYVMVNIPAAEIEAVRSDRVDLRHKAIVGKIDRQTPILSSKIH